jgi:hypothetical protein
VWEPSNNAFHLTARLACARPSAGECERWADQSESARAMTTQVTNSAAVVDCLPGTDSHEACGVEPDQRVAEAIDLVEKKRDGNGRWPLENPHAGEVHFDMEDGTGKPSRWETLRALRVLDWYFARD